MTILVVKFGTEVLTNGDGLDPHRFVQAARQIIRLQKEGIQTIIVSSGAIQAGREQMAKLERDSNNLSKKILAGIGSRVLLNRWSEAFTPHTEIVQFWLTYQNWENKGERESIKSGLLTSLETSLVPVINENDVVSDEEIRQLEQGIGENDQLARMIVELVNANQVLFLTKIGGVYTQNPATNAHAELIEYLDPSMAKKLALDGTSNRGTGGMGVKVKEALSCARNGARTAIAPLTEDSILRFGRGELVGTAIR